MPNLVLYCCTEERDMANSEKDKITKQGLEVFANVKLQMVQKGHFSLDEYLLPEDKVDLDRFIVETIADVQIYDKQYQLKEDDKPLITILYHLNDLPEGIGATTFEYRHKFRGCLYSQDKEIRRKTVGVYYKLLIGVVERAETIAITRAPDLFSRNLCVFEQSYPFDQLRQMIYEDVVYGSLLAPVLKAAV